jgi:hypothetical protein
VKYKILFNVRNNEVSFLVIRYNPLELSGLKKSIKIVFTIFFPRCIIIENTEEFDIYINHVNVNVINNNIKLGEIILYFLCG